MIQSSGHIKLTITLSITTFTIILPLVAIFVGICALGRESPGRGRKKSQNNKNTKQGLRIPSTITELFLWLCLAGKYCPLPGEAGSASPPTPPPANQINKLLPSHICSHISAYALSRLLLNCSNYNGQCLLCFQHPWVLLRARPSQAAISCITHNIKNVPLVVSRFLKNRFKTSLILSEEVIYHRKSCNL